MKTPRLFDLLSHALLASLLVVVPAAAQSPVPAAPEAPGTAGTAAPEAPELRDFARSEVIDRAAPGVEPATQQALLAQALAQAAPDTSKSDSKNEKKAKPAKGAPAGKTPPPQFPSPPPTATRVPPRPGDRNVNIQLMDVTITGDQFVEDTTTGNVTITGNPRVVRGTEELRATRIIYNRRTQQATAEGDVILRRGDQEFHASRATYDFSGQSGEADNVKSLFRTVYLDAEQIFFKPGGVYEYRRTKITTCDKPDPHYLLSTRSVDVIPGERMTIHHAGFDLLGVRLITLPTFEKNLASGEDRQGLIPTFGYDPHNGPYVRKEFVLRQKSPAWVFGDVQLNTFRDPQGGIVAATPGNLQLVGSLFYRDVAENQRAPHLQVSRLPEVGVVYSSGKDPRPGRFLPNQITGVDAPKDLALSQQWRFGASLTAGYFLQHRGDDDHIPENRTHDGSRLQVQGQAVLPLLKLGPLKLNNLRFMARQSVYNTGDAYTLLGTGIGKRFNVGSHFSLGVDRFDQWFIGHTPFLFDEVELRGEWRPRIEYHTRGTNISYYARLRDDAGIYDQVFSISHLFHCIEPRLSYSARRGEIFLEFRIPGLVGLNRSGAGEPRSVDTQDEDRPATRRPVQTQPEQ